MTRNEFILYASIALKRVDRVRKTAQPKLNLKPFDGYVSPDVYGAIMSGHMTVCVESLIPRDEELKTLRLYLEEALTRQYINWLSVSTFEERQAPDHSPDHSPDPFPDPFPNPISSDYIFDAIELADYIKGKFTDA